MEQQNNVNNISSSLEQSKVHNLMSEVNYGEISFDENVSKTLDKNEAKKIRQQTKQALKEQNKKHLSQQHSDLYFESDAQAKAFIVKRRIKLFFVYFFLTIGALFTLIPFYWMIITSFKTTDEIIYSSPATLFPMNPSIWSYQQIFSGEYNDLILYIGNTLIVAVCTMCLSVTTVILAAFAFSRLEFKGRDTIFALLLATMMVPGEMMTLTNYTTVINLGWLNGDSWLVFLAMIFPFGTSVFYTFFLRQSFKQIPNELYYAAKVDGNSDFKYLFKVMLPIARPTIITIIILSIIGSWNAYIWPRTVTVFHPDRKLITDGLMMMFAGSDGTNTDNIMMAATTIVSIPLLLAFVLFKKYIMRGVSRSGIKG